ncbi:hypothetical protein GCM10010191_31740 [Actinomadura vinacea]|uniref:Uncharacterized protein n=1 Tax=Actinomadura vinacea TaxID=115336 RepID=A0ABN3IZW5_9ACTN
MKGGRLVRLGMVLPTAEDNAMPHWNGPEDYWEIARGPVGGQRAPAEKCSSDRSGTGSHDGRFRASYLIS